MTLHSFRPPLRALAPTGHALRVGTAALLALAAWLLPGSAQAWDWDTLRQVSALTREGQLVPIARIAFTPDGQGGARFALQMEDGVFRDHFLSMKEFKCLEGGGEVLCHVPYPYRQPQRVGAEDFAWLEHSLLFLYKQPRDFGAKLWNGLYFRFTRDAQGLVGRPQAIDLNHISAPPDDLNTPPYGATLRDDVPEGAHWIERLVIR